VWTKLDRYWLLASETAGCAAVDLKSRVSVTVTGAPTFTANQGYVTSTSKNVNTNYIPSSSAVNLTQNSATYGCFVNTNRTIGANRFEFGAANGAFDRIVGVNTAHAGSVGDTYTEGRINCTTIFGGEYTSGTQRGSWLLTRNLASGTNAMLQYYNGSSAGFPSPGGTSTGVSTGLPDVAIIVGGLNLGGSFGFFGGAQISSFYVGSGFNPTEALAFYNAERALMTSVGLA